MFTEIYNGGVYYDRIMNRCYILSNIKGDDVVWINVDEDNIETKNHRHTYVKNKDYSLELLNDKGSKYEFLGVIGIHGISYDTDISRPLKNFE